MTATVAEKDDRISQLRDELQGVKDDAAMLKVELPELSDDFQLISKPWSWKWPASTRGL